MFDKDETSYSGRFNDLVRHYFDNAENTRDQNDVIDIDTYKDALNKIMDMYVEFKGMADTSMDERDSWNLDHAFVDVVMNQIEVLAQISNDAEFKATREAVHNSVQLVSAHVLNITHLEDLSEMLAEEAETLFSIAQMYKDPEFRDPTVKVVTLDVLEKSVEGLHNLSKQLDIEAKATAMPGFNPKVKH